MQQQRRSIIATSYENVNNSRKHQQNKLAMNVESTETPRTKYWRQWLGANKTFAINTSTNSDSEMNKDDETVVQCAIGDDMQKTRCNIKLFFAVGEFAITSCLLALR